MDNKPSRLKFYNFKNRQYKRQPFILEFNVFYRSFILCLYPPCLDTINTFRGVDYFLSLPSFKFSYKDYKEYHYENLTDNDWYNLLEEEPF
jgi:hypothetical protein